MNKVKICQCTKYQRKCVCRKAPSIPSSKSSVQESHSSGYESTCKAGSSQVLSDSTRDDQHARHPFPSTLDLEPNIYYYTKNGLVGSEESNIYYKISKIDNNIFNYINSKLKYTPDREYFENVEKLRFRLPTAKEYCLKSKVSAEDLDKRVENVRRFRENNLDDCVNEEEQEFRSTHRCIHRYRLNSRGYPEPLFKDEDGNSVCSDPSCYTPSKYLIEHNISPMNCENRFVIPNGSGEEFLNNFEEFGPVLLLEAPKHVEEKVKGKRPGQKKLDSRDTYPVPNSLALRFQRRLY